jgi:hypothetical protein
MLVVETIAKIRRLHLVEGRSIKAICRDLGLSRKVVRKVLRSGATEFRYARRQQPLPKLGPWQAELDRLLAENAVRSTREQLTLIRLFETLRELGYSGGYDAVRRYAETSPTPTANWYSPTATQLPTAPDSHPRTRRYSMWHRLPGPRSWRGSAARRSRSPTAHSTICSC